MYAQTSTLNQFIIIIKKKYISISLLTLTGDHVIGNITEAIAAHKDKRNSDSILLYQTLMNIVTPPPGQKLMRATARLFDLVGRKGLSASLKHDKHLFYCPMLILNKRILIVWSSPGLLSS